MSPVHPRPLQQLLRKPDLMLCEVVCPQGLQSARKARLSMLAASWLQSVELRGLIQSWSAMSVVERDQASNGLGAK